MIAVKATVVVSGILLALGLTLHVAGTVSLSATVLAAGLMLLMAVPVMRIFITIAEWIREKDWPFAAVTLVVLVELTIALLLATRRV